MRGALDGSSKLQGVYCSTAGLVVIGVNESGTGLVNSVSSSSVSAHSASDEH